MSMKQQEVLEYALRYIAKEEVVPFPMDGDLFCLFQRELPADKLLADEEGWQFAGYHVCEGYLLDEEAVPAGKWVWMHYTSLATFPPTRGSFKLQPPHVARGLFQNPTRTTEYRIVRLSHGIRDQSTGDSHPGPPAREEDGGSLEGKILRFPLRRSSVRNPPTDDGLLPDRPA